MRKPDRSKPKSRWHINVPIYNVGICVSVAETLQAAAEATGPRFSASRDQLGNNYTGVGISMQDCQGNFALAFKSQTISRDAISHEIDHTVGYIFGFIDEDHPGSECRAYLCGWITKKVSRILTRNAISVKD